MPRLKAKGKDKGVRKGAKVVSPVSAAVASTAVAIPTIKASAMSKDVGPAVVIGLHRVAQEFDKANEMLQGVAAKRYDLLGNMTFAIVKAAKADDTIDLTATVTAGDAKGVSTLNDQLLIALGIREVIYITKGDKQVPKLVYSKAVASYFKAPGEDKDLPEVKRKETFRSNFMHQIKLCARTALGIIERKIDAKVDKKSGTLMLSGPSVKQQFGQSSVLLNEKQTVKDGEKEVKLDEKPSFTAIAAKAAEAHGTVVHRGTNTRGVAQSLTNPGAALATICASMISALSKVKKPSAGQIAEVRKVHSACDKWLNDNNVSE